MDFLGFNFALIPFVVVLMYAITGFIKAFLKTDTGSNLLPYICTLLGGIIGVILFFADPTMLDGINSFGDAFSSGAASGLAAIGINQIAKKTVHLATGPSTPTEEVITEDTNTEA